MSKRKKVASVMFTGAAAAAVTGAGIQPAGAVGPHWNINGGNGAYSASNSTAATLTANVFTATCFANTVTAAGSLTGNSTSGPPPHVLGTVNSATFGSPTACTLLGQGITATLDHSANITAAATAAPAVVGTGLPTPNNATSGKTTGYIGTAGNSRAIEATITGVGTFACTAHVHGSIVPAVYSNPSVLNVNANNVKTLTIESVVGCNNLIHNGDLAAFKAKFVVDSNRAVTTN